LLCNELRCPNKGGLRKVNDFGLLIRTGKVYITQKKKELN